MSLYQQSDVLYNLFSLYVELQGYRNILKLKITYLKNKKG